MSAEITDLVLDEVRSLRAKLSTLESISSSSSTSVTRSSVTRESNSSVREYSSRPSSRPCSTSASASVSESVSSTSMASAESRKRPLDEDGLKDADVKDFSSKTITPVLRYSLSNVTYRVNLEALSRVFSQYGRLIKLTRFPNHGTVSGYVQFENVSAAEMTMAKLQGRNIYHGCCRLHLSGTDIVDLTIRRDMEGGEHAVDLSAKRFGGGDGASPMSRRVPDRRGDYLSPPPYGRQDRFSASPMGVVPDGRDGSHGRDGGGDEYWRDGGFRDVGGRGGFGTRPSASAPHLPPIQTLWPGEVYGRGPVPLSGVNSVRQAKTVLFVANLNESKTNTDRLFMVFGVYCDIIKIKIFYHERSKALIQAMDGGQADTARRFLDGVKLWGSTLSVTFASAKYQELNIPPNSDEKWAKDFSYSSFTAHRFRGNYGMKHFQNVTKPIPTLYVSNVPRGTSEDKVKKFFEECLKEGEQAKKSKANSEEARSDNEDETPSSTSSSSSSSSSVLRVQFFPKNEFMAFVEMASVDAAFEAIIKVHNTRIESMASRGKSLFVNFSKVHLDDFNKSGWDTLFRG